MFTQARTGYMGMEEVSQIYIWFLASLHCRYEHESIDATFPPDYSTVLWIVQLTFTELQQDQALSLSFVAVPGSLVTSLWATSVISWKYW